jgi:hypothetical protein
LRILAIEVVPGIAGMVHHDLRCRYQTSEGVQPPSNIQSERRADLQRDIRVRIWLTPEQRAQFDAKRYFDVIGCDSGKRPYP